MSAITVGARAARRSARRPGGFPARTRRAKQRKGRDGGRDRAVSGQFSSGKPHIGGRWLPQWLRSASWAPGPRGGAAAPSTWVFRGFSRGRGARVEAAIAQLARAAGRGTLARVCFHFPERLGAVTAAATGRGRAAGPRRPHRGAVRIGRPAIMAQLARAAGWGSLIWVVNDSSNGTGR